MSALTKTKVCRRAGPLLWIGVLSALPLASVEAGYWFYKPSAVGRVEFDTNRRLRTNDEKDTSAERLAAYLDSGYRSETWNLSATGWAGLWRVQGESDLNSEDLHLDLRSGYTRVRDTFGLDASVIRDTTLTSEFDLTATGFVDVRKDRDYLSISPHWSRELSENAVSNLRYSYLDIFYEKGPGVTLIDYTYQVLMGSVAWQHTENWTWSVIGQGTRYEGDQNDTTIDSVLGAVGADWTLSERTDWSFQVGVEHSDSDDGGISNSDTGLRFLTRLSTQAERWNLGLRVERVQSPNSQGVQTADLIALDYRRELTPVWDLNAGARATQLRNSGDLTSQSERDYQSLTLGASRALSENMRLAMRYRYRHQEYLNAADDADSHALILELRYNWDEKPFKW